MNHGIDSQNKKLYLQLKKIRDLACIFLGENPKLREKKTRGMVGIIWGLCNYGNPSQKIPGRVIGWGFKALVFNVAVDSWEKFLWSSFRVIYFYFAEPT